MLRLSVAYILLKTTWLAAWDLRKLHIFANRGTLMSNGGRGVKWKPYVLALEIKIILKLVLSSPNFISCCLLVFRYFAVDTALLLDASQKK